MVKLLALLALAAVATSTVDATAVPPKSKPFLKFDKTTLNVQGNVAGEKLSVSLNEKPTDDVVVYLEAPNTRFDKCSLAFTPDNFDKPQELTVVSMPFADVAPGARNIPIKFTAFTEDCADKHHNVSIDLPTTRTPEGSGQCQVTGDPHFKSFDNANLFHYMGVGDYYIVKSESLVVQARQGKCFGKASCVHALAVRYGGASFVIDSNDANPNTCVKTITNLDGVVISKTRSGQVTTVNVALNAGSSLKIDIYGSGDTRFLNVYVNLANHMKGKVNGLCGRFDGTAANDFSTPDGQEFTSQQIIDQSKADMFGQSPTYQQSPLFKYGESWRVPEPENLFKCRDNCPGLGNMKPALPAPVAECKIPTTVPKCDNPIQTLPPASSTSSSSAVASSSSSSVPAVTTTSAPATTTTVPAGDNSSSSTATQGQSTSSVASSSSSTAGQSTSSSSAGTTTATDGQQTSSVSSASTATGGEQTSASSSSTTAGQQTSSSTAGEQTSSSTAGQQTSSSSSTTAGQQTSSVSSATTTSAVATTTSSNTGTSSRATSTLTTNNPQPTQPGKPGKPGRPGRPGKRPPICPRPIIVVPIPPGYRREKQPPRYRQEPRLPEYRPLPQPPRQVIDEAKRGCARKIVRVDQCNVDVGRFVTACEADIDAQMNPDLAYDVHRDAYTDLCSKIVIDKCREPFPDVARRAREALKKHSFGNQPCDKQCLQCSPRGCLECKDRNRFEVQGGRCVARQVVRYDDKFFSQRPKYRALADDEIVPDGGEVGDDVDPSFNANAVVETDSVLVAVSEDPVKAQEEQDKKEAEAGKAPESSAMRLALSSLAGVAALAVSVMF